MSMTMQAFLGHKSTERDGQYLGKWKDRPDAAINTWLHQANPFAVVWRHQLPRIVERDVDGEKIQDVWTGNYVCHEEESVLKRQHRRNPDGSRFIPPRECGMCKMIEYIRGMVESGEIKWTTPVFKFEVDDPRKCKTLYAGGLYGAFGDRDLTAEEKKELNRLGIYQKEAWQYNAMAKLNYVFCVVDNDDPAAGVQIAVESTLLGDKVKEVIRKAMKSYGEDEGNPMIHPYCIRWEYHEKAVEFGKRYDAMRMDRIQASPLVLEAIRGPAPSMSNLTDRYNPALVRAILEKHAVIDLPLDKFFALDEESSKKEDDDLVACDACGKAMHASDIKCVHCGQSYEVETSPEPVLTPPPPALPKRSETKAAMTKAQVKLAASVAKAVVPDEDSDDLPF